MEDWMAQLQQAGPEAAWDLFLDRYRRLIFAAIRHYAQDYDDVMDVFARVCEALREDDLRKLRAYAAQPDHRARCSTWLVTVVRHLTVDWFRHRDGRRHVSIIAEQWPPLRRRIFEHVFIHHHSHVAAYEMIRAEDAPALSFGEFLAELRTAYRAVTNGKRGHVPRRRGRAQSPRGTGPRLARRRRPHGGRAVHPGRAAGGARRPDRRPSQRQGGLQPRVSRAGGVA